MREPESIVDNVCPHTLNAASTTNSITKVEKRRQAIQLAGATQLHDVMREHPCTIRVHMRRTGIMCIIGGDAYALKCVETPGDSDWRTERASGESDQAVALPRTPSKPVLACDDNNLYLVKVVLCAFAWRSAVGCMPGCVARTGMRYF
jgi:hypothetical protein